MSLVGIFNAQLGSSIDTKRTAMNHSFLRQKNQDLEGMGTIKVCAIGVDQTVLQNAFKDDITSDNIVLFKEKAKVMSETMIPLEGAEVICYDDDTFTAERMGNAFTDEKGCATVVYNTNTDWDWWGKPDIFCEVTKQGYGDVDTNVLDNVGGSSHTMDTVTLPLRACGSGRNTEWIFGAVLPDSFQPACVLHDFCYDTCGVTKSACDAAQYSRQMVDDLKAAKIVLTGVHFWAEDAYEAAQKKACEFKSKD